jgi:adenylate cyclase
VAEKQGERVQRLWRETLLGTNPADRAGRAFFAALPSPPRCELCAAPFKGPFTPLLRLIGKRPLAKNPRYCEFCFRFILNKKGGAEVGMSALFADVRGSTPMAERLGATGTHAVMDRCYGTAIEVLIRGGALIDRFMGNQVVGYFVPGFAGGDHARHAIETGLELLRATGHLAGAEPWVPVGAGVHTGTAFIRTVGRAEGQLEVTALGEDVNIAARLASVAGTGELVCSEAADQTAALDLPGELRELTHKGVSAPVQVRTLHTALRRRTRDQRNPPTPRSDPGPTPRRPQSGSPDRRGRRIPSRRPRNGPIFASWTARRTGPRPSPNAIAGAPLVGLDYVRHGGIHAVHDFSARRHDGGTDRRTRPGLDLRREAGASGRPRRRTPG